jgi:hypothetical protein
MTSDQQLQEAESRFARQAVLDIIKPIVVTPIGRYGAVWSFNIGHGASFLRMGGATHCTEEEARQQAERAAIAMVVPYKERIGTELASLPLTYGEIMTALGVRPEAWT